MTTATELYRENVSRLAIEKKNERITNSGRDHAEIVLENMLRHANSVVRIYSGSLRDVYRGHQLIDAAQEFLKKEGTQLRILVENEIDPAGQEFLKAIASDRVNTKKKPAGLSVSPVHFSTADDRAYRIELDDKNVTAIVNFSEPDIAIRFSNEFDKAFEKGLPISV